MNLVPAPQKTQKYGPGIQVSASNSRGKLTTMKSRVIVQKLLPLEGHFFLFTAKKTNKLLMAEKFALF